VFEVASIKPSPADSRAVRLAEEVQERPTRDAGPVAKLGLVEISCRSLIRNQKLPDFGGPPWLHDARFDISAKIPEGVNQGAVSN